MSGPMETRTTFPRRFEYREVTLDGTGGGEAVPFSGGHQNVSSRYLDPEDPVYFLSGDSSESRRSIFRKTRERRHWISAKAQIAIVVLASLSIGLIAAGGIAQKVKKKSPLTVLTKFIYDGKDTYAEEMDRRYISSDDEKAIRNSYSQFCINLLMNTFDTFQEQQLAEMSSGLIMASQGIRFLRQELGVPSRSTGLGLDDLTKMERALAKYVKARRKQVEWATKWKEELESNSSFVPAVHIPQDLPWDVQSGDHIHTEQPQLQQPHIHHQMRPAFPETYPTPGAHHLASRGYGWNPNVVSVVHPEYTYGMTLPQYRGNVESSYMSNVQQGQHHMQRVQFQQHPYFQRDQYGYSDKERLQPSAPPSEFEEWQPWEAHGGEGAFSRNLPVGVQSESSEIVMFRRVQAMKDEGKDIEYFLQRAHQNTPLFMPKYFRLALI